MVKRKKPSRQLEYRDRMIADGFVQVKVWVPVEYAEAIRSYAQHVREGKFLEFWKEQSEPKGPKLHLQASKKNRRFR